MAKKRLPGEGYIGKRSDGRLTGKLYLGLDEQGKPKVWQCYGRTKAEVLEKLDQARRDRADGLPVKTDRQTVAGYLADWLEGSVRPPHRRHSTYVSYESKVRLYINPAIGNVELSKLTPQHVQRMTNDLLKRGLAPRTVQYAYSILHAALEQAVAWQSVQRNVADLVRRPSVPKAERPALAVDEVRRFLSAVGDDRLGPLYIVTVGLGLRQGEVLGISWADVDLPGATVRLRGELQRIDGAYQLVPLKTAKSRATLPLPGFVRDALTRQRRRQEEERRKCPDWQDDVGLAFTTETGRPINGSWLTHRFQRTLGQAGLPVVPFHALRHTCGSLLAAQGVPMSVVRDILRHTQISTTADIYVHTPAPLTREALDQLDGLLGAPREPRDSYGSPSGSDLGQATQLDSGD